MCSALSALNSGASLVRRFVAVTHGPRAACPHPRAAPNLVAVALAAIDDYYRGQDLPHRCHDDEHDVLCFADIIEQMLVQQYIHYLYCNIFFIQ